MFTEIIHVGGSWQDLPAQPGYLGQGNRGGLGSKAVAAGGGGGAASRGMDVNQSQPINGGNGGSGQIWIDGMTYAGGGGGCPSRPAGW